MLPFCAIIFHFWFNQNNFCFSFCNYCSFLLIKINLYSVFAVIFRFCFNQNNFLFRFCNFFFFQKNLILDATFRVRYQCSVWSTETPTSCHSLLAIALSRWLIYLANCTASVLQVQPKLYHGHDLAFRRLINDEQRMSEEEI